MPYLIELSFGFVGGILGSLGAAVITSADGEFKSVITIIDEMPQSEKRQLINYVTDFIKSQGIPIGIGALACMASNSELENTVKKGISTFFEGRGMAILWYLNIFYLIEIDEITGPKWKSLFFIIIIQIIYKCVGMIKVIVENNMKTINAFLNLITKHINNEVISAFWKIF